MTFRLLWMEKTALNSRRRGGPIKWLVAGFCMAMIQIAIHWLWISETGLSLSEVADLNASLQQKYFYPRSLLQGFYFTLSSSKLLYQGKEMAHQYEITEKASYIFNAFSCIPRLKIQLHFDLLHRKSQIITASFEQN